MSEQHCTGSNEPTTEHGGAPFNHQSKNTAPCAPCREKRQKCDGGTPCPRCEARIQKGDLVQCVPGKRKDSSLSLDQDPFKYETGQRKASTRRNRTSPDMCLPASTQQDGSPACNKFVWRNKAYRFSKVPSTHSRTEIEGEKHQEFRELQTVSEDATPSWTPEGSSSFVLPMCTSHAGYTFFPDGFLVEEPMHDNQVSLNNSFDQTSTPLSPFVYNGLGSSHISGHYVHYGPSDGELIQQVLQVGDMAPTSFQPYVPVTTNNAEIQPLMSGASVDEPILAENNHQRWSETTEVEHVVTNYNHNDAPPHVYPDVASLNPPTDAAQQSERRGEEAFWTSFYHPNYAQWLILSTPQIDLQPAWTNSNLGLVVEDQNIISQPPSESQPSAASGYVGYLPEAYWNLYESYALSHGLVPGEVGQAPSWPSTHSSAYYQVDDSGVQPVRETIYSTESEPTLAIAVPSGESGYEHFHFFS